MSNEFNEIVTLNYLPMWYITNIHIKDGYRKPNTNIIFLDTLLSIHNDTLNIWINLIGVILFLLSFIVLYFDSLNKLNKSMLILYSLTCVLCFASRLNYYVYSPNNETTYYNLIKQYYINNLFLAFVSMSLIIYCMFYEEHYNGIKYSFIIVLFIILTLICPLFNDNNFYSLHKRKYRSTVFTLYTLYIFIPTLHYGIVNSFITFHYIFFLIIISIILLLYYIGLFIHNNYYPEKICNIINIGNSDNICNLLVHTGCIILYLSMRYILYYLEKT